MGELYGQVLVGLLCFVHIVHPSKERGGHIINRGQNSPCKEAEYDLNETACTVSQ